MVDELKVELYKSLRSEAANYVEKVPALWLQKFLLTGAMIAVGVIENPGSPLGYWPVVAAIVALAIVLDAKMLEYGLHARLISSYIAARFPSDRLRDLVLGDWEHVLWGYGARGHMRRLAKIRSWLTLASAVVPTMVIALLGGAYIDAATGSGRSWLTAGSLVCLVYAILCAFAWKWMFTRTALIDNSERPANKRARARAVRSPRLLGGLPHAKAIPLAEWQDPVEDVAILFSERRCTIFFSVGDSEKVGKLSFERVWAIRSVRTEVAPYYDTDSGYSSYIVEVIGSPWPAEVEHGFYTETARERLHNESRHFLVKGHDIYHEVLCRNYSETYLAPGDSSYGYAKQCLDDAEP